MAAFRGGLCRVRSESALAVKPDRMKGAARLYFTDCRATPGVLNYVQFRVEERRSWVVSGVDGTANEERTTGILPSQAIRELIAKGRVIGNRPITEEQIQPASLDLRLGDIAHRVQASFLPGPRGTVEVESQRTAHGAGGSYQRGGFRKGMRLHRATAGGAAICRRDISGKANPKSTTGRLDIFIRLITDDGVEFERVPPGYKGRLYAEIVSRTFTVAVRAGMRLNQLRFVRGNPVSSDNRIRRLDEEQQLDLHGRGKSGEGVGRSWAENHGQS